MASRKTPPSAPADTPEQPADDAPVDVATGEIVEDADADVVVVDDDTDTDADAEELIAQAAGGDDIDVVHTDVVDPHPVTTSSSLAMLPTSSDPREWTDEQKALLDAAGLVQRKGGQVITAPRATIRAFLSQCHRTGLDPIAKQIYCIERGGKWTIQTSIDGFRVIAERSGSYQGQTPVQWTADGVTWVDAWVSATAPAAARVGVYRKGFREALYAVARFASYDAGGPMWKKMPEVMIAKCAEALALRKAFPQDLSGLFTSEEMEKADSRTTAAPVAPRTTLREIHAAGVDEHKLDQAPAETTVIDHTGEDTQLVLTPETWAHWKEVIDGAETMLQLGGIRNDAGRQGLLDTPIPGDEKGRKINDYFLYRKAQLAPAPSAAAERLQQGLHQDKAVS